MKTVHTVRVGELQIVLRSNGLIYIGNPELTRGFGMAAPSMLLGSSSAICSALAEGFREMAEFVRNAPEKA